ncbi:MAG: hypothetical protein LUM44_00030 [Pyrinomonadaceae bacterium]|nr:hypothetical protein [Pyrinomonadaceae bacterium]
MKFTSKFLVFIFAFLFFSSNIFADTLGYVSKAEADKAVSALNITKRLRHFCAPCNDKTFRDEQVDSVYASKADETSYRVIVNGKAIDLGYVYFPLTDGKWKNLAAWVGYKFDYIPEFLEIQTAPTNPPPRNDTNATEIDWMPVVEMDKQIFPAFFLATATKPIVESQTAGVIGDAQGLVGMHIINPKANTRLKIGIEIDSILKYQEFDANLAEKGKYYQVYPKLVWNWNALKSYKKAAPANASFALYLDGKLIEKKNVVVRIRSVNEAVYAYSYLLDENRWANTKWLFAAYVNEDHEWIDQILKEALNAKVVDSFTGYQEDYKKVFAQVFAVWYVLQKRNFKYSSITNTSGTGTTTKVYSQYVRLFDESINGSQANCVDGSVLIASILKKIGLRVGLVLIPGHCFLVFDITGKGDWRGLETTMMGSTDLSNFGDEKSKAEASMAGFFKAVDAGTKSFGDSLQGINQKDPRYNLIDIDEARRSGIYPLSW